VKVILKTDRDFYEQALAAYEQTLTEHHLNSAAIDAVNQQIQAEHDATDGELREPDLYELPPDPVFTAKEPPVYDAREVEEPEEVDTPWGVAIAMPGTIIVTGADGSFVVPAATFASDYDEGEG